MSSSIRKLLYEDIAFEITENDLIKFDKTTNPEIIIGQPRAMQALVMGTEIRSRGYNIFVTGLPGTGRQTAVKKVLREFRGNGKELNDIVYVYDFKKPFSPRVLYFPKGTAKVFRKDIHRAVENIKRVIDMQFESESYNKTKNDLIQKTENTENSQIAEFESELAQNGFQIVQIGSQDESATDIQPLIEGKPVDFEDYQRKIDDHTIPLEEFNKKRNQYYLYMDKMKKLFEDVKKNRTDLDRTLESLKIKTCRPFIKAENDILRSKYPYKDVLSWIHDLEHDMENHLNLFIKDVENDRQLREGRPPLARYGVNIIADFQDVEKCPIIFENHPEYSNLFGSYELQSEGNDDPRTGFLKIQAGSFVHASGGFLILKVEDVLQDEMVWINIKRVLQTGKVEIQAQNGPYGSNTSPLKPEPIKVDVKVIMIGNEMSYDALYNSDNDFQKLFKISAEFDSVMNRNDESTCHYLSFMKKIVLEEELLPITMAGAATVIEYGVRLSEYRTKLSTQFSKIADLLREADFHARKSKLLSIGSESVICAIETRSFFNSLPAEKFQDMIVSGQILLDVSGNAIGRVNGLAVHDRGYYSFGVPAVISAQVAPGESGVINIEGESGLSGEIYDKAVLIVEGYLRSLYARSFPLSITASICFEQLYTAVEGDSASSTTVYALLSAIAQIPLRQDIAVTGSVNQMGRIQPVGGVSEKIEGFYDICKRGGLSGTQGVMIPNQNIVNLTLSHEVQNAVKNGDFHIYAISTIDEGIELLSGMEAGKADEKGLFPQNSFNNLVMSALKNMADLIHTYTM